jgi:hypothetical protein
VLFCFPVLYTAVGKVNPNVATSIGDCSRAIKWGNCCYFPRLGENVIQLQVRKLAADCLRHTWEVKEALFHIGSRLSHLSGSVNQYPPCTPGIRHRLLMRAQIFILRAAFRGDEHSPMFSGLTRGTLLNPFHVDSIVLLLKAKNS